jgi:hydrophobic/amphiphilic exporter-1 (mainly G- bacteria), HAE1 family
MSKFFIDRPVFAIVISIIMVLLGILSMARLPISQFPNIVPPQISLATTYVGADAVAVQDAVAIPIEEQMSGVDGMIYMYSVNASNGQMTLYVNFQIDTSGDTDQILSLSRYLQAQSQLPQPVQAQGITIKTGGSSPLAMFALYSPKGTYDEKFLANYAYININDPMTRVPGVGQVTIFGAGEYAMRLWVKPPVLSALGVTTQDIANAIQQQNVVNPGGLIGGEPSPPGQGFTYNVKTQGRLLNTEEFGEIVVKALPGGAVVRVKDVARIELGSQNYYYQASFNGSPAAAIAIYQSPGSNALDTVKRAKALMDRAKERFPDDIAYTVSLDTTLAVTASFREILNTLWQAMLLVLLVVYVFLQGLRPTFIPAVAVPVSLIGTFAVFPLLGFSINTLSLFGLVLAIGLVVDDAIVVVEAVERKIEEGMTPREAAIAGMEGIQGPIVATALILCAVFVPTVFIPGITGLLYQQFAVTIAVSVVISAFNALTLSPALAALLLRKRTEAKGPLGWFFGRFNAGFDRFTNRYVSISRLLIRKFLIAIALLLAIAVCAGWLGSKLPGGLIPPQDNGFVYAGVQLPAGTSLQRTAEVTRRVEKILIETPGVEYVTSVTGYSMLAQVTTTYDAFFFVSLKPWDQRKTPETEYFGLLRNMSERLSRVSEGFAYAFSPPPIPGIGTAGGVTFLLQDRAGRGTAYLAENARKFQAIVAKRPEFERAFTTFQPSVPQIYAQVDRDKVRTQGVALNDVYQTLQTYFGGTFINLFNRFGRTWQVYAQAEAEYRNSPDDLQYFYVKNAVGRPVPLSDLVTLKQTSGPEFTLRFNEYESAQFNIATRPGVSNDAAMAILEKIVDEQMPRDIGYAYSGMSFQEKAAAQGVSPLVIFGMALLFVFLILAAQYESWSLPASVLVSTPIAVFGAYAALVTRAFANDTFAQIGLTMIIGLAAKNAILIVEYARDEHSKGKSVEDAALTAARLRIRPILMTAFAFLLGTLPLAMATGSGALSRQILGTTVIGGTLAATLIAIFMIPAGYYMIQRVSERGKPRAPTAGAAGGAEASPSALREKKKDAP